MCKIMRKTSSPLIANIKFFFLFKISNLEIFELWTIFSGSLFKIIFVSGRKEYQEHWIGTVLFKIPRLFWWNIYSISSYYWCIQMEYILGDKKGYTNMNFESKIRKKTITTYTLWQEIFHPFYKIYYDNSEGISDGLYWILKASNMKWCISRKELMFLRNIMSGYIKMKPCTWS